MLDFTSCKLFLPKGAHGLALSCADKQDLISTEYLKGKLFWNVEILLFYACKHRTVIYVMLRLYFSIPITSPTDPSNTQDIFFKRLRYLSRNTRWKLRYLLPFRMYPLSKIFAHSQNSCVQFWVSFFIWTIIPRKWTNTLQRNNEMVNLTHRFVTFVSKPRKGGPTNAKRVSAYFSHL